MTRLERTLRDLVSSLGAMDGCGECVSLDDATCSSRHFNKYKKAINEAKRLLRQLDNERADAKKKPN